MTEIIEIPDSGLKSDICNHVLRALPDWFGIERSIVDYVSDVSDLTFYAASDCGDTAGFAVLKIHNEHTAEIYVMGILQEYHRRGIGASLIERCVNYCRQNGLTFLTVKTLDESNPDLYYERTRRFYLAMGFKPLEVFPTLWNVENPCLLMAMHVGRR